MRLVVTADTHSKFSADAIPDGDVFIHCGDLMYTGHVGEWYPLLECLAALPHKQKFLVPGNHDYYIEHYLGLARSELRRNAGVKLLMEDSELELAGRQVLATPAVTGLGGWAFNTLEITLDQMLKGRTGDIVLTHAPMYKVLDAINPTGDTAAQRNHVGSWALAAWYHGLEKKPEFMFHGHIHESYGEHHEWGTSFYNVAMCDRDYQQVNAPVIIDL